LDLVLSQLNPVYILTYFSNNHFNIERFEVFIGVTAKVTVILDVLLCGVVNVCQCFKGRYDAEDGGSAFP
jgi:hypothetical protein